MTQPTQPTCERCGDPGHCACFHAACCACGSKGHMECYMVHPPFDAAIEHHETWCRTCSSRLLKDAPAAPGPSVMPAREALVQELRRDGVGHTGMGALRLIEAYAHELAEQLRAEAERMESRIPEEARTVLRTGRIRGLRYGADLIDPEVQR